VLISMDVASYNTLYNGATVPTRVFVKFVCLNMT
jgi:hypothetical protein